MSKIKINIQDPETRAVWDTCLRAKEEVNSWPNWKKSSVIQESEIIFKPGAAMTVTKHILTSETQVKLSIGDAKIPGPSIKTVMATHPPKESQRREAFQATLSILPSPFLVKNGYMPLVMYFYPTEQNYEVLFPETGALTGGTEPKEAIQAFAFHLCEYIKVYQEIVRGHPEDLTSEMIHNIEVLKQHIYGI